MEKAFIRADASVQIGIGHVMRCLTLAGDLVQSGMEVFFVTRYLSGNLAGLIRKNGFKVVLLPFQSPKVEEDYLNWLSDNWESDAAETCRVISENKTIGDQCRLVVDHYALDYKWEQTLRPLVNEITVIDDLANRLHDCDKLLDQNYYRDMQQRYQGLVPAYCQLLLGPKYALLRPEFYEVKRTLRQRDGVIRRILVFFGGSDPTGETLKTLEAIKILARPDVLVDVVVGASTPRMIEIEQICSTMPLVRFHCQIDNMAELMGQADLAIGAGGSVTWERCFLGLPSIVITVAENQVETVRDLAEIGAVCYLGWHEEVSIERLAQAVEDLTEEPQKLRDMCEFSMMLFGEV